LDTTPRRRASQSACAHTALPYLGAPSYARTEAGPRPPVRALCPSGSTPPPRGALALAGQPRTAIPIDPLRFSPCAGAPTNATRRTAS
jgi:hypothetical protein